ncbi:MAG: hypothetical protein ACFBSD_15505 [Paracoccaceae bacterium]
MKFLMAAVAATSLLAAQAGAVTFDIVFDGDNIGDGVIDTIVGTGTISFDDPGGTGTFDFFSLANVSFSADFPGFEGPFTLADLDTTTGTEVILSGPVGSRDLVFSGSGDGFADGSIDFNNGAAEGLSFGATGAEGFYQTETFFGDYQATEAGSGTVIPLPPTLPFLLAGLAGLGLAARRGR